ncbi:MAG: hypothetical protein QT00_C0002G0207 [archaeon GW2011_AR5]|nr:MAG: hypothetical protein QT00_C0002G0207 [archaeon GW2011_AR5]
MVCIMYQLMAFIAFPSFRLSGSKIFDPLLRNYWVMRHRIVCTMVANILPYFRSQIYANMRGLNRLNFPIHLQNYHLLLN